MKKLLFFLLMITTGALAQGGPGPQPSQWKQNGSTLAPIDSTSGIVMPGATGGYKGPGTINVTNLYKNGMSFDSVGTVTSVGLILPSSIFGITVSPITGSGNLTAVLNQQNANLVFAGPSSGGASIPTMRALVPADVGAITAKTLLANTSGSSASPTAATLTAYLDAVFGTTQGSVLYRNSTIWTTLGPGTSGTFLKTLGAAANPIWDTPAGSGTINSSTANNLAVYSGSTALSGVTTGNNGLLVTSGAGVPSIATAIPSGVTATTQSPADNSTKVATTAYADAAVAAAGTIPTGTIVPFAGLVAPSGWQLCTGSPVLRASFTNLYNALTVTSTITVTIASPGVVTWTGHALSLGSPVVFTTTSALPTGITAGVTYFVNGTVTTNTFNISATVGGANINTTGSQSGTQTGTFVPYGNGNGTTTFNLPDLRGRFIAGVDNMGGSAAGRLGTGSTGGITGVALPGANGGQQAHTLTATEQASMSVSTSFSADFNAVGGGGPIISAQSTTAISNSIGATGTATGGGGAHNVTPPVLVMNYIIKN